MSNECKNNPEIKNQIEKDLKDKRLTGFEYARLGTMYDRYKISTLVESIPNDTKEKWRIK